MLIVSTAASVFYFVSSALFIGGFAVLLTLWAVAFRSPAFRVYVLLTGIIFVRGLLLVVLEGFVPAIPPGATRLSWITYPQAGEILTAVFLLISLSRGAQILVMRAVVAHLPKELGEPRFGTTLKWSAFVAFGIEVGESLFQFFASLTGTRASDILSTISATGAVTAEIVWPLYGIIFAVYVAYNRRFIGDKLIRHTSGRISIVVGVFFANALVCYPTILFLPSETTTAWYVFESLSGIAQLIFYCILGCVNILFGIRYLVRAINLQNGLREEFERPAFIGKSSSDKNEVQRGWNYEGDSPRGLIGSIKSRPEAEEPDFEHSKNKLTVRETQVIRLLCEGFVNKEVADALGLSAHTVRNHIYSIYRKIGISTRAGLVRFMSEHEPDR